VAEKAVDLYFKNCSMMVTTGSLARFGAMLANNGIVPSTGERLLKSSTVQAVVTVMTTCGMYNGAGKFTKEIGVPAKSGVSGGLLTIMPSIGAVASFSPRINPEGNSVRGMAVIQKLNKIYNNFNLFHKDLHKKDCSRRPY
jgi:glutaminase